MKSTRYQAYIIAALLLFTITAPISNATQEAQEITTRISSWLVLGPHPVPLPAFHEEKTRSFTLEDLLKFDEADISHLKPKADSSFRWHDGALTQWKEMQAGHGISGRGNYVLFLEEIVRPQCYQCNVGRNGRYEVFVPKLIDLYTREQYDHWVSESCKPVKISIAEYELLIADLNRRLVRLIDEHA